MVDQKECSMLIMDMRGIIQHGEWMQLTVAILCCLCLGDGEQVGVTLVADGHDAEEK